MIPRVFLTFYRLSMLLKEWKANAAGFRSAHPHAWLVWEAGDWQVPSSNDLTTRPRLSPVSAEGRGGSHGDSLCFALQRPAKEAASELRVGRVGNNEIIINDATVSRTHLVLQATADGWSARRAPQGREATCRGVRLEEGAGLALGNGDALTLGSVTLTFHDAEGFLERLKRIAAQAK